MDRPLFWLIFAGLFAFAVGSHLNFLPLRFEEPRRAIVALEMMLNGDMIKPTINGVDYFNKPPIYNWILVGLFNLFGFENWVIRMPTVLSLMLIGILHFFIFKNWLGKTAAVLSSIFFVTSADILFYFSFQGEIDMFYTLIVYLQLVSIGYWYYHKQKVRYLFMASYFLMTAGLLTKGMPSLAFQGLTLLGIAVAEKKVKWLFSPWHLIAIIASSLGLIGFFTLYENHGGDTQAYLTRLLSQSTERTALGEQSLWNKLKHLFTFIGLFLRISLPWVFLWIFRFKKITFSQLLQSIWENTAVRFAIIFLLSNLWLYWLSPGTRNRYLYMFLPFFFIPIAHFLPDTLRSGTWQKKWFKGIFGGLLIGLALFCISLPFLPKTDVISGIWLIAILGLIVITALTLLFFKASSIDRLLLFAISLLVIRSVFNYSILPVRKAEDFKTDYKRAAHELQAITKGQRLYLYEPKTVNNYGVPILGGQVSYGEIKWPPYQISYHISNLNGHVLQQTSSLEDNKYYLVSERFMTNEMLELWRVYCHNRGETYYLVRKK